MVETNNSTTPLDDLKSKLDPETYRVTQEKGTEAPFSGKFWDKQDPGQYHCAVCGQQLFSSTAKYTTKSPGLMGWPSFTEAIPGSVKFLPDDSQGMHRTEVVCAKCNSHLGHVFEDEHETDTGKHFCINSCALKLEQ